MINIIFVILSNNELDLNGLESILKQKNIDFNVFICSDNIALIQDTLAKKNITCYKKIFFLDYDKFSMHSRLLSHINSFSPSKYTVFHENNIISGDNRLLEQSIYLDSNPDINFCSCLANTSTTPNSMSKESCDFENTFTTHSKVDEALLGYYIPLSLTSLFIKTIYLSTVLQYSTCNFKVNDNVSFILLLFRYSSINKITKNLITYNGFSGYENYSSQIGDFNISKTIELRPYLIDSINDTSYKITSYNGTFFNILIILDKANLGGTELYVYALIKCLLAKGFNITLATTYGVTYPIIKKLGINFLNIDYDINKSFSIIESFVLNTKVDLIHCHLENSMQLGKALKEKYNIPFIITLHGTFYSTEILKETCGSADAIISVSKPVDKLITSLFSTISMPNHYIINNGISLNYTRRENIIEKLSLNSDSKLIIYCSRLGVGKGRLALNVLYSLKELLTTNENLYLIIIGEGFSKLEIQNLATEFNDSIKRNAIICTGAIYNVKDYFSKASVVIGTGRVIIEALSVNTPSIAYGLEGLLGIITPNNRDEFMDYHFGDHGYIDLTENMSLIEMVNYILDNKDLFKSYAESNFDWCSTNFNEIINTNSIIDIYNFSLNKPPKHYP